jgi:hypothetical protein
VNALAYAFAVVILPVFVVIAVFLVFAIFSSILGAI